MRAPLKFVRALVLSLLLTVAGAAQEVQLHGLVFEEWVRDEFFAGYRPPSYTQKWDIPAAVNCAHGGVPVNLKAAKYGTPVDLGDALRQFDIAEPFIFVIGYWRQEGDAKRFVNILNLRVEQAQWRKLWGAVTRADLEKLDALIKDRSLDFYEARERAQAMKHKTPFTQSIIVLNPKIDAKTQRRLQCSLRFEDVFKYIAPEADLKPQAQPSLWGVTFPDAMVSKPREFSHSTNPHSP